MEDVVTSSVDDYNVDSRFRGNDGLWVGTGNTTVESLSPA